MTYLELFASYNWSFLIGSCHLPALKNAEALALYLLSNPSPRAGQVAQAGFNRIAGLIDNLHFSFGVHQHRPRFLMVRVALHWMADSQLAQHRRLHRLLRNCIPLDHQFALGLTKSCVRPDQSAAETRQAEIGQKRTLGIIENLSEF